jgi:hypothetical protein
MKRHLLLPILALALSAASFAGTVNFSNSGGPLTGSNSGLTLTGSVLFLVNGLNGGGLITGNDLGSVDFTTAALTAGSLQMGGMFAPGGSLTIATNGTNGLPDGTVFAGTFSGPAAWTLITLANGTHNYVLAGDLSGMLEGAPVTGALVQITVNTGSGFFHGTSRVSSGDIALSTSSQVIPEPSSLGLVGTGLIGLAGLIHRKRRSS